MPTVKILFNAVVSEDADFATLDLTDFYLGSRLPSPEYIKIYVHDYPESVLSDLGLADFVQLDKQQKRFVYFSINGGLYGLPQAGKIAQNDAIALLKASGFHETATPCLFRHATRDITFCLVVDDYGVKYTSREDLDFLVDCLSAKYHVKVHPVATKHLGITINYIRKRHKRVFRIS